MFAVESCDDTTTNPSNTTTGPAFLVGSGGSGDTLLAGLYKMTNSKTELRFELKGYR